MIQRIQTVYMVLLILINMFIVISTDSNPEMSLSESHFGFFRPYINDYFFSEFFCIILLVIIFFFKKPKIQINFLRVLFVSLIFGLLNFFDERSFEKSITDPALLYFLVSFFLIFVSITSIKKDQAIISSSNRLR
ncbi:MAG: DUF4293 family protein [Flavobacteriaceae bacterium]|nr:DUF4293 family protein [Flavobacteriaceae bacterium]